MRLEPNGSPGMVHLYWPAVSGSLGYDVITGDLADLNVEDGHLSLGAVGVLARGTTATTIDEGVAGTIPPAGSAVFYLIQTRDKQGGTGYGTESAPWPRQPAVCDAGCP